MQQLLELLLWRKVGISSVSDESQKGINDMRTRRVLLLYKVYGGNSRLVLTRTSLNSNNAHLFLSWRYVDFSEYLGR